MAAVFIAQSTLTEWTDAGKVRLEGTTLHLIKEQRSVLLKPAVRFVKLVGSDADPHGLLGKVKTEEQLKALGAEHYLKSVLLGDVAYEVVEGFLGDLMAQRPQPAPPAAARAQPAAPSSAPSPNAPPAGDEAEPRSDAEALSKLFLDTVR